MFLPCRLDTSCALLLLALAASSSTAQSLLLAAAVTPSPARQNRRIISDRQAYQHLSKVFMYPVKFKSGGGILIRNLVRIVARSRYPYSGRPVIVEVGELVAEPLDVLHYVVGDTECSFLKFDLVEFVHERLGHLRMKTGKYSTKVILNVLPECVFHPEQQGASWYISCSFHHTTVETPGYYQNT